METLRVCLLVFFAAAMLYGGYLKLTGRDGEQQPQQPPSSLPLPPEMEQQQQQPQPQQPQSPEPDVPSWLTDGEEPTNDR